MILFSCGMWDLVPWPGIEPGPPALGMWSLNHWTIRKVPKDRDSNLNQQRHKSVSWGQPCIVSLSLSLFICLGLALCLTHIGYLTFVKLTYHWRHMENLGKKMIIIIQHIWVLAEREETVERDLVPPFQRLWDAMHGSQHCIPWAKRGRKDVQEIWEAVKLWLWKYCPWVVIKGSRCGKGVLFEGKRFVRAASSEPSNVGFSMLEHLLNGVVNWKKNAQHKRCELCFIQGLTKDCNSGDNLSVALRNCSKDTVEEPVYVWVIVVRKSIWSNVHLDKRWPLITKNIYLKLMILVLFEYVVLHHLPEFAQIHVHWVGDAIQPSHLLSSASPALSLSQH